MYLVVIQISHIKIYMLEFHKDSWNSKGTLFFVVFFPSHRATVSWKQAKDRCDGTHGQLPTFHDVVDLTEFINVFKDFKGDFADFKGGFAVESVYIGLSHNNATKARFFSVLSSPKQLLGIKNKSSWLHIVSAWLECDCKSIILQLVFHQQKSHKKLNVTQKNIFVHILVLWVKFLFL